jgi:hypothetical protein
MPECPACAPGETPAGRRAREREELRAHHPLLQIERVRVPSDPPSRSRLEVLRRRLESLAGEV